MAQLAGSLNVAGLLCFGTLNALFSKIGECSSTQAVCLQAEQATDTYTVHVCVYQCLPQ
jgi:hypothetical protein